MYQPETTLKKKEPFGDDHPGAPYNHVKVIGQSPINHGTIQTEWIGAQGQGVIVQPLDGFGATLDEPYGKLQDLYEIDTVPDNVVPVGPQVEYIPQDGSPSPEDIFRTEASEPELEVSEPAKPLSPLDGEAPSEEELAEREAIKERVREQATGD